MALTVTVVEKPISGISVSDIPKEYLDLFTTNVPACIYVDPSKELDKKTAGKDRKSVV